MKLAVIIPAYNEEICIQEVIRQFHSQLPNASIFVIDNNSKDSTNALANKTLQDLDIPGKVIFVARQGKANAMREAFRLIDADYYIMVDADLTYSAQDIQKLLEPAINKQAHMVVGDRLSKGEYKKENKRFCHNFGNSLVRCAINLLFGSKLQDIMSGYRVFSKLFVKNYPILTQGFDLETEMTIHAVSMGFSVIEVPITYKDRPEGSFSKLNTYKDGLRVLKKILSLFINNKPMLFFGLISVIFLALAVCLGVPPLIEFLETNFVNKVPSLIVACFFGGVALLSFSFGILFEGIRKHHYFDYHHRVLQFSALYPEINTK